jgi:hypothetical protein
VDCAKLSAVRILDDGYRSAYPFPVNSGTRIWFAFIASDGRQFYVDRIDVAITIFVGNVPK